MGAPDLPFLWRPAAEGEAPRPDGAGAPRGNECLQQPFVFPRLFDSRECARIREIGAALPTYRGISSSEDPEYRKCRTSFLEEREDSAFVFERVRRMARVLRDKYRFRLAGFTEPLHFITYDVGCQFGWHTDLGEGDTSTRKISISIQLSEAGDYAGGDLEFCPHGQIAEFRGLGNALAFPAYIPHRVLPITSGRRHALVAWLHGPAFE